MIRNVTENYRVLQVGIGVMGMNHINAIKDLSKTEPLSLCGVCDSNLDKLVEFRENNPSVPVFLVYGPQYQSRSEYEQLKKQADLLGIQSIETVSEAVEQLDVNTLMNCTNNDSHIPVLESALSIKSDGKSKINMVFQEKPFAHTLQEAETFIEKIKDEEITFSLNSILEYSGIWRDFHSFVDEYPGTLKLSKVITSYGKDRTQDTRPATGGWVGMEGIHAVDISTALLKDLVIEGDKTVSQYGFLAKDASEDGHVNFGIGSILKGNSKKGTGNVEVEIEGSFAWQDQMRRTIYIFEDVENNKLIASQILFDKRDGSNRCDELKVVEFDLLENTSKQIYHAQSNMDKLRHYYSASIDPSQRNRIYDIKRAMDVQGVLESLSRPAKVFNMAAVKSEKKPKVPDLSNMSAAHVRALKYEGIDGLKKVSSPVGLPPQKRIKTHRKM